MWPVCTQGYSDFSSETVIGYTGFMVPIREALNVINNKIANAISYEICVPGYTLFCIHKLIHEFSYAFLISFLFAFGYFSH